MRFAYTLLLMVCIYCTGIAQIKKNSIHLRSFEKDFTKIPGVSAFTMIDGKQVETISLHMYHYEVSNQFYRLFLEDLKHKGLMKKYELARVDTTGWSRISNGVLEMMDREYFTHPAFNNHPVVNISHTGALLFCQWLTDWYNGQPKRKLKDKKVRFELPNAEAWEIAARGHTKKAIYPWETKYLRGGKRNEALCNYKQIGEENLYWDEDGKLAVFEGKKRVLYHAGLTTLSDNADLTAPVKFYKPNVYGLYNMSGNAAEMMFEKGVTRGGSWNSTGYEVRIQKVDAYAGYTGSSPYLGFRVVMIVEEK